MRTPIGRHRGALAEVRPDDLGAVVIAELVKRTGADPAAIDDVQLGCANQAGEDNRNVARMSALLAGLPVTVPGATVNRLCGSGLEAVVDGARAIAVGDARSDRRGRRRVDVARAAGDGEGARGVSARRRHRLRQHARLAVRQPAHGGDARDARARRDRGAGGRAHGVTREEQDAFALESQRRWAAAQAAGRFADELVRRRARRGKKGAPKSCSRSTSTRGPRPPRRISAALAPVFRKSGGTVTAGNSSGINDGAAAVLLASEAGLKRLGAARRSRASWRRQWPASSRS